MGLEEKIHTDSVVNSIEAELKEGNVVIITKPVNGKVMKVIPVENGAELRKLLEILLPPFEVGIYKIREEDGKIKYEEKARIIYDSHSSSSYNDRASQPSQ